MALTDAKPRHRATDGAKKRQVAPSSLQRSNPFIRLGAEKDSLASSNFSRGKTDNLDMRTKWRNPICDRAAGPSRREKANV